MTNKITKEFLFTELSIKIAILEAKIDKLLQLVMDNNKIVDIKYTITGAGGGSGGINPPRWPNESHTDYLKRIGQYNEASVSDTPQSEDEFYGETYK